MLTEQIAVTLAVADALDTRDYLRRMAVELGVTDLLERALEEAN